MRSFAAVLSVFLFLAVGEARAGLADGKAAYDRGDYITALREWQPLAEQGDAEAQHSLGNMYFEGRGVPQDDAEAVRWWRRTGPRGGPV